MASSSSNIPVNQARTYIDRYIEAHERTILQLKARRNTLAPVYKLPQELILRIFSLVKEDAEHQSLSSYIQSRSHLPVNSGLSALKEWIGVTHVCNRWRQIALNASTLWTRPPIDSKPWTLEMLKRSKMAGLILDLYSEYPSMNSTVMRHIQHIKSLKIHYDHARDLNMLFVGFSAEAPQLESLNVSVTSRHLHYGARDWDQTRFTLQPSTFRDTKALRRLTISGVDIQFDSSPLLRNLTHLSLRNLSSDSKPSWKQLMDALEQMPDLQALDLDRALPTVTSTSSPPLHLPHLQELAVYSVLPEVHSFFTHITFPQLRRLYVGCRSPESGCFDYGSVITALSRSSLATDNLGVASIVKLELHQRMAATYGFCIEGFSDPVKASRINMVESDLEFLFGPPSGDGTPFDDEETHPDSRVVREVFSRLSFVNVTELAITAGIAINARVMMDSFGRLPRLNSIRISSSASKEMIRALTVEEFDSEGRITTPENILFKALHTIIFEWVAFNPHAPFDPRVEELQDLLMQRCEYFAPIQYLRFNFCRFLKRLDIERLAEIVPDVHWDEQEVGFWSEDNSETETDEDSDVFHAFLGDIDPPFYSDGYSIW